jgi:hypothetical protein
MRLVGRLAITVGLPLAILWASDHVLLPGVPDELSGRGDISNHVAHVARRRWRVRRTFRARRRRVSRCEIITLGNEDFEKKVVEADRLARSLGGH